MDVVTFAASILLAAAAWLPIHLLLGRRSRGIPARFVAALSVAVVCYFGILLALVLLRPDWLNVLALVAIGIFAWRAWRARSGYGRSRNLPPGSLSLASSLEAIVDPDFYRDQFSRHGQVFKMAQLRRGTICILGLERGHKLLLEHADALGPTALPFSRQIPLGFLRYMKPSDYQTYGPLFRSALARPIVEASEIDTRTVIRRELGALAEDCANSAAGRVAPFRTIDRIVLIAFLRVMFDIASGTAVFDRFEALYNELLRQDINRPLGRRSKRALVGLRELLDEETPRWRRRIEAGDQPTCVVEEMIRLDPSLPDITTMDNLLFIVRITTGNLAGLLCWILVELGRHGDWMDRLRVASGSSESSSGALVDLQDRVIMETLRLHQSEYLYRTIVEDFQEDGHLFPRGWLLRLCVKESHRSAEIFKDPEAFDPDRFADRRMTPSEYSPFGFHQHACNGVPLTYMVSRALLAELAQGFDYAIVDELPQQRDFRHSAHWCPSSKLGLAISFRPAEASG